MLYNEIPHAADTMAQVKRVNHAENRYPKTNCENAASEII